MKLKNLLLMTTMVLSYFSASSQCDTLHYPLPGSPTIFTVLPPQSGYVCGNNTYGDLAKADYFEPAITDRFLHKAFFDFAIAAKQSGQNPNIIFKIWSNSGTGGYPGNVLGTALVPLNQIFDDVVAQRMTTVKFIPPVAITGPFYLGVVLPVNTGDTIALICTNEDEVDPNTAFEQWYDSTWHAYDEPNSWQLKLTHGIYPLLCDVGYGTGENQLSAGMKIFPSPTADLIHLEFDPGIFKDMVTVTLYNFLGQVEIQKNFDPDNESIILSIRDLANGVYLLTISGKNISGSQKIIKI